MKLLRLLPRYFPEPADETDATVVVQDTGLEPRIVVGAAGAFTLKVASTGLAFLTRLVVAQVMGAAGYGVYSYAMSWVFVLTIPAVLGLDVVALREIARARATAAWAPLRGMLRWSTGIVSGGAFVWVGFGAGLIVLIEPILDRAMVVALWPALLILPPLALVRVNQGVIQGLGRVVASQIPQLIAIPLVFLCLLGAWSVVGSPGPEAALILRAVATVLALLIGLWLVATSVPDAARSAVAEHHTAAWLRSGTPLLFAGVAHMLSDQVAGIMVGTRMGPAPAGIYEIAASVARLVAFVAMSANAALAPEFAALFARGEMVTLQRTVVRAARMVVAASAVVALGLIMGRSLVLWTFGSEFRAGAPAVVVLCVAHLLNASMGSAQILLNMTGHERDTLAGGLLALTANVLLNLLLIPSLGLIGAAFAHAGAITTWSVYLTVAAYRRVGIIPTALVPQWVGVGGR